MDTTRAWRRIPVAPLDDDLDDDEPITLLRDAVNCGRAIDNYLAAVAARGCAQRTQDNYWRVLYRLYDALPEETRDDLRTVRPADCEALVRASRTPHTQALTRAVMSGFFRWLSASGKINANPMESVPLVTRTSSPPVAGEVVVENELLRDLSWGIETR